MAIEGLNVAKHVEILSIPAIAHRINDVGRFDLGWEVVYWHQGRRINTLWVSPLKVPVKK